MSEPYQEYSVKAPTSKDELEYLWKQKNELLMMSISLNEQHLYFVKKKMEKLKRAIMKNIVIFLGCVVANCSLWTIKLAVWGEDQPTFIGICLFSTAVVAFFDFLSSIKNIRMYIFHVAKDMGWKKPQAVDKNSKRKPAREQNYKAEYDKVNWILREYDQEKEIMFTLLNKIDSGEINDADDLQRQLHEVLIYEEVTPAMK